MSSHPISISVIIPTYNRAGYIVDCINSVLAQTYPVKEILICDDGSTDETKVLVSALKLQHLRWLDCGKNGRPAIPRNMGIKQASGDWLAFLDSDDTWLPEKIELQVACILNYKAKIVCTNAWAIQVDTKKMYLDPGRSGKIEFQNLIQSNTIMCSSILCEKKIVLDADAFPESNALKAIEDYVLWIKLLSKNEAYYIDRPLVNYLDAPALSIRGNNNNAIQQRQTIFEYFKSNRSYLSKTQLLSLYHLYKLQYKPWLKRIFDFERYQL